MSKLSQPLHLKNTVSLLYWSANKYTVFPGKRDHPSSKLFVLQTSLMLRSLNKGASFSCRLPISLTLGAGSKEDNCIQFALVGSR